MDWERIESQISLNDPESRFHFESRDGGVVELTYYDWQNRRIVIRFVDVAYFTYGHLPPDLGCPEGHFCRKMNSPLIEELRESRLIEENAWHYLIGSNEDEWCEIVAGSHYITVDR